MSNTTKYKDGPKRSVFKTIPKNVEIVQNDNSLETSNLFT